MSVVQSPTANVALNPRRAYITTSAFNTDLYTYTVTVNPTTFVRSGTLAANVTGATASSCPANRILRENGKRLYPEANPSISTLLVGVYDAVSGLSGFIDPNGPKFAVYNSDKANYMINGVDPATGLTDQGQPVYTRGSVTAGTTVSAGTTVTGGTGVIATTGQVRAATVTDSTTTTGNITIDFSLGQVFRFTSALTGAVTLKSSNNTPGAVAYLIFYNGGGQTIAGDTTTVKSGATATATNNKTYTVTLVSDGTLAYQVALVQGV
jgi:hypothetical protein